MARGTSLLRLVQMVREECGRSSAVGVSVDDLSGIKTKVQRTQELFYEQYDWTHLRQMFDRESMSAGERYYDPSAGVNFDRIEDMVIWYNGLAHPIERGIEFSDYNQYDSESDQRSEPTLKWDIRWTGSREQIEFWPIPSTNDQFWQIKGIRSLRALAADADVADLDDRLIALTVAAELLAGKDDKSAGVVASLAKQRLDMLIARPNTSMKRYRMGMGETDRAHKEIVIRVGS